MDIGEKKTMDWRIDAREWKHKEEKYEGDGKWKSMNGEM